MESNVPPVPNQASPDVVDKEISQNIPTTPPKKTIPLLKIILLALIAIVLAAALFIFVLHIYKNFNAGKQASAPESVTITYFSGDPPNDSDAQKRTQDMINDFTKKTGIKVQLLYPPESLSTFTDTGLYIEKKLDTKSTDFDTFIVDGTWTSWFADNLLDVKPYLGNTLSIHFPQMVEGATIQGRVVAVPFFQDTVFLFYRTDLLKKYGYTHPPTTWDELEQMSLVIQNGERKTNPKFWGYLWQASPSESLTSNGVEFQASFGGGAIIDGDTVTINNPENIKAFEKAKSWIGKISPPETLQAIEEDSIASWTAGNAAFMRNWVFAYQIGMNEDSTIKDKFDVALLPSGGFKPQHCLGGEYLAASKYTKHPKEVVQFLEYMTGKDIQKKRAIAGINSPSIISLYDDPDVQATQPYYPLLKTILSNYGVSRPGALVGKHYNEVSTIYFTTVNDMLSGKISVKDGLQEMEKELVDLTGLKSKR